MRLLLTIGLVLFIASAGCKKTTKPSEKSPDAPQTGGPRTPQPPQVSTKDMEDIRIFIDNASGASGRMPSPQMVSDALKQSGSPAANLVKNGQIVIPPARSREDLWAYEAKAIEQGGYVAGVNGVEQVTAAEVKRRLGK